VLPPPEEPDEPVDGVVVVCGVVVVVEPMTIGARFMVLLEGEGFEVDASGRHAGLAQ
jgi:hypothetical protein